MDKLKVRKKKFGDTMLYFSVKDSQSPAPLAPPAKKRQLQINPHTARILQAAAYVTTTTTTTTTILYPNDA